MLKAGFGRTDITPTLGTRLGGYGIEHRPAEEVFDNLHSTALILKDENSTAVQISLDWVEISEEIVAELRKEIKKKCGIKGNNINISVSHSHSTPNIVSAWGWGEADQEYIDSVLDNIVKSVVLAEASMEETEVGFATVSSLVGVSRRHINEENIFDYSADENGLFDPEMTVVRFRSKVNNQELGIIVHYGAHCTAMGANRLISRDWCGVMKDRVESQFKAPVLFLNGAIGGVGPRTNLRIGDNCLAAGSGDGVEAVREVGYRAATDAMQALLSIKDWRKDLELQVKYGEVLFPYAPLMPLEEAQAMVEKYEPVKHEYGWNMCEYEHNKAVVKAHSKIIEKHKLYHQSIIVLGPLAIVPFPGEVFPGITLRIKHGSPYQYTLCSSITNGYLSYLFTREAILREENQKFEVWSTKTISPYRFADELDDALVQQNLEILRKGRK